MMGIKSHMRYSGGLPEHRDSRQILVVDVLARLRERDIGMAELVLFNEFLAEVSNPYKADIFSSTVRRILILSCSTLCRRGGQTTTRHETCCFLSSGGI